MLFHAKQSILQCVKNSITEFTVQDLFVLIYRVASEQEWCLDERIVRPSEFLSSNEIVVCAIAWCVASMKSYFWYCTTKFMIRMQIG